MTSLAPAPRLLVVEDDAELLNLVQGFLEEEGYSVTSATSLPDSLTALEERLFHFVLTDLFYEPRQRSPLASIQPLLAQAAPIPVGVMTAWPIPEEATAQANLTFLLRKPFDLDDLLGHVDAELHPTIRSLRQHTLVEEFFAALAVHDWQLLSRLCTPDVTVAPVSAPAVASFGSRQGLPSFQAAMERRFRLLPGYSIEGIQVFPRTMGVAARYVGRWQDSNGTEHRASGSMYFRFRHGRIAQIEGAF